MNSPHLPLYMSNARHYNEKVVEGVIQRRLNQKQMLNFCRHYRTMAIGSLLLACDSEAFCFYLYKSGRAYLYFLQGSGDEAKITSRSAPFFDTIAAKDFDGASAIASHSRQTRRQGSEYEEDFLYIHFLMKRFFLGMSCKEAETLLLRYEQVLEGSRDERLDVCRSLVDLDSARFNEALVQMLHAQHEKLERLNDFGMVHPVRMASEHYVSVEAVALAVLAERSGLQLQKDYPFVPSIAREGGEPLWPPDSWKDVTGLPVGAKAIRL